MHAVHDILSDADLLQIPLPGIGVVGIHDDRRVFKPPCLILVEEVSQVLIVIVGHAAPVPVRIAPKDRVRHGIARRLDLPPSVKEFLWALGRLYGIHHDLDIAARRILHPCGNPDAARHDPVQLVLHGARADRDIGQKVREIPVVFRIEHLLGAGKAGLADDSCVHLPDGDDARQHILFPRGIGLVEHSLVADALGPRLVRIDSGDDKYLFLHLLLDPGKPCHIVEDRVLPVRGAGADDKKESLIPAEDDIL